MAPLSYSVTRNAAFVMGERPGGSDFGAYGQLTQLTHFDPDTIRALLAEVGCVYVPVLLANAKALMAANRSRRKSMASRGCSSPSPIRENVSSGCAKNMPR